MTDPGPNMPSTPQDDGFSYRSLLRNYISLTGLALAAIALANIIVLFIIDITSAVPSPYTGILAYMILPGFLLAGLALAFIGAWRERSRRLEAVPGAPALPRIDLNQPGQRSRLAFFVSFVVVFVLLSAVGSYRAYEFTDSTTFCGELCHTVMHPEAVAHDHSAHARVSCVECHVGSGAGWYVKSKLSGARQVVKTILNTYPRPIESPVANLRPAAQTCEQCHWPRRFWGAQLKVFNHFASDEQNTPRQLRMLIKVGGGDPSAGGQAGIHWHMNIANKIEYKSDAKRQTIPWVRITDRNGKVTEYQAAAAKRQRHRPRWISAAWIAWIATTVPRTSTRRPTAPWTRLLPPDASTPPCPLPSSREWSFSRRSTRPHRRPSRPSSRASRPFTRRSIRNSVSSRSGDIKNMTEALTASTRRTSSRR